MNEKSKAIPETEEVIDDWQPDDESDTEITPSPDIHLSDYPDIVDYLNSHQPDPNDPASVAAFNRRRRLAAIIEFARTKPYKNQFALVDYLTSIGLGCNQGQLSKDLDALELCPYTDRRGIRRLGRRGKVLKYSLAERYTKVFFEAVFDATRHGSTVVLNTLPNFGQGVATIIEASTWMEVDAVLCGPCSVSIVCWDEDAASRVLTCIREGIL